MSFNTDFQQISIYLKRMIDDEKNILENHRMNLALIQQCLGRMETAYNNRVQQIDSNGNSSQEEQW